MSAEPADIRATAAKLVQWHDTPFLEGMIVTALWTERERCAAYVDWYLMTQTSIGVDHIVGLVDDIRTAKLPHSSVRSSPDLTDMPGEVVPQPASPGANSTEQQP